MIVEGNGWKFQNGNISRWSTPSPQKILVFMRIGEVSAQSREPVRVTGKVLLTNNLAAWPGTNPGAEAFGTTSPVSPHQRDSRVRGEPAKGRRSRDSVIRTPHSRDCQRQAIVGRPRSSFGCAVEISLGFLPGLGTDQVSDEPSHQVPCQEMNASVAA